MEQHINRLSDKVDAMTNEIMTLTMQYNALDDKIKQLRYDREKEIYNRDFLKTLDTYHIQAFIDETHIVNNHQKSHIPNALAHLFQSTYSYPVPSMSLRKGDYIMINGRPCRIINIEHSK